MSKPIALAAAFLLCSGLAASAEGRMPNSPELAALEQALKSQGFTSWKEIELEHGVWEVDDAIGPDSKRYDLKLDSKSLQVSSKVEDKD